MAEAPGHRLGQIIGDLLEFALSPLLTDFAEKHDLYLDKKGERPARSGVKCSWTDSLGNSHDLDFVLERGGTREKIGLPAAFIETAWRRYTKHSRAKAQEIQGAVLPLLATHQSLKPFAGAVIAGEWTSGAIAQLRSSGFSVLHIPYDVVVSVFAKRRIDIDSGEDTPDSYLAKQVSLIDGLSDRERRAIADEIRTSVPEAFSSFMTDLRSVVLRTVREILVVALYGEAQRFPDVPSAVSALAAFRSTSSSQLDRFEIHVRYSNGDEIRATFAEASNAVSFLSSFE